METSAGDGVLSVSEVANPPSTPFDQEVSVGEKDREGEVEIKNGEKEEVEKSEMREHLSRSTSSNSLVSEGSSHCVEMPLSLDNSNLFSSVLAVDVCQGRERDFLRSCYDANQSFDGEKSFSVLSDTCSVPSSPQRVRVEIDSPPVSLSLSRPFSLSHPYANKVKSERRRARRITTIVDSLPVEEGTIEQHMRSEETWRETERLYFEMVQTPSRRDTVSEIERDLEIPRSGYYESIIKFSMRYRSESQKMVSLGFFLSVSFAL
jgi:hypothetical protein